MRNPSLWLGVALFLGAPSLLGCDSYRGSTKCTPGRQVACACSDGSEGIQVCSDEYTFGRCSCAASFPNESPDNSHDDDPEPVGDGDAGDPAGEQSGTLLAAGSSKLIELFVKDDDVWIVDRDGVTRRSAHDGTELAHWDAPRPLATAAFDGENLVAADGAKLNVLNADTLEQTADGTLLEACASSVLLAGGRFVCGPANDWDRIFSTYDVASGDLLASSNPHTYNGIPMSAIPGRAAFVTVTTNSSPSDFHVYELAETHEPIFRGESPYHGDFGATMVFAFDNSSAAKSLITHEGLLLRVDTCDGSAVTTCLEKNGALGTLTGSQRFVGMDTVGESVFGLISTASSYYGESPSSGYLLQVADVPSREVTFQEVVQLNIGQVVALRGLPEQAALVVGYRTGAANTYPYNDGGDGYEVVRLPLDQER